MPRPLRLELEGAVYHVVARGNERKEVFRDDSDREAYLDRLAVIRRRFGFYLYAYCLMDNHVHLALERGNVALSRIMLCLQSCYSQRFNRRHGRVGHLFQGRYKAFLVEKDRYLWTLLRYIHSNPLRAGLTRRPQDYAWSSDRHFRAGRGPEWLDLDRVLGLLAGTRSEAVARYRGLMDEESSPYEDLAPMAGLVKGADEFALRLLAPVEDPMLPKVSWTPQAIAATVASIERIGLAELTGRGQAAGPARARSIAAYLAKGEARIPVSRMARYFGRDESTLVKGVQRLEALLATDARLRSRIGTMSLRLRSKSSRVHG